jgi:maleylpyruvate isomerase
MTPASHLTDNLALLAHETSLLVRTATGLDDESIREPSRCEGWTRAHVLSHLARNSDGLRNLVGWAITGTPVAMYESAQAREADIESGSHRGTEQIVGDLETSAARFASVAPDLAGPPEHSEVELRAGRKVLGGQLPTLRLLEVVFHHVDLDAGYSFADADPGFVKRAITNAVNGMIASSQQPASAQSVMLPSVVLFGDNGDTWSMGDGTQEVTGTNAALLLWLARGDDAGVSSEQALPRLPAWG